MKPNSISRSGILAFRLGNSQHFPRGVRGCHLDAPAGEIEGIFTGPTPELKDMVAWSENFLKLRVDRFPQPFS
jgi:hypothetical protein